MHGGIWTEGNLLLTQYHWKDDTPLLNTSTAQLCGIMNQNLIRSHPAIVKWEMDLGCRLPEYVWEETWITYRAAKENAFL